MDKNENLTSVDTYDSDFSVEEIERQSEEHFKELRKVMNREEENMTLLEACQLCREGNFVSHRNFDSSQSMHEYQYSLYYEDGANVSHDLGWIENQEWAKDGWFIKYSKEQVDKDKLNEMHRINKGNMLYGQSYEECIIK